MSGTANRSIRGHTLVNSGHGRWLGGGIIMNPDALIHNAAGATLEILHTNFAAMSSSGITVGFYNEGAVVKRSASLTLFAGIPVRNLGVFDIESGELEMLEAVLSGTGSMCVRSNATLTFSSTVGTQSRPSQLEGRLSLVEGATPAVRGGQLAAQPGSEIAGAGSVLVQGGGTTGAVQSQAEIWGGYNVRSTVIEARSRARFHSAAQSADVLLKDASTELGGPGLFDSSGEFVWTGGTMTGGGTTRLRRTLQVNG